MLKAISKKTKYCLLIVIFGLVANPAYAGKVQTQLHVSAIIAGHCSVHSQYIADDGYLHGPPIFACNHTIPVKYYWNIQQQGEILIDQYGSASSSFSNDELLHYDHVVQQPSDTASQKDLSGNIHTLTILY